MAKRPSRAKKHTRSGISADSRWSTDSYIAGQTLPWTYEPNAYARWLFEFLKTDLSVLSSEQDRETRANLRAFVRAELPEDGFGADLLPTEEATRGAQSIGRQGIQRVLAFEWFELEKGIAYGIARAGDQIIRGSTRGSFADLFRAAVMDVVQEYWDRLYDCPRCHSIFVKAGKQKYCSTRCMTAANWDRFKENRPVRDHRQEYLARVRKRLGSKVRVQRRGTK